MRARGFCATDRPAIRSAIGRGHAGPDDDGQWSFADLDHDDKSHPAHAPPGVTAGIVAGREAGGPGRRQPRSLEHPQSSRRPPLAARQGTFRGRRGRRGRGRDPGVVRRTGGGWPAGARRGIARQHESHRPRRARGGARGGSPHADGAGVAGEGHPGHEAGAGARAESPDLQAGPAAACRFADRVRRCLPDDSRSAAPRDREEGQRGLRLPAAPADGQGGRPQLGGRVRGPAPVARPVDRPRSEDVLRARPGPAVGAAEGQLRRRDPACGNDRLVPGSPRRLRLPRESPLRAVDGESRSDADPAGGLEPARRDGKRHPRRAFVRRRRQGAVGGAGGLPRRAVRLDHEGEPRLEGHRRGDLHAPHRTALGDPRGW